MIHIYTGNGKGKTTSSFGLAMRAAGRGFRVIVFQFLKPKNLVCGEEISAKKIKNIKIVKYNEQHPMFCETVKIRKNIKVDIREAKDAVFGGKYDMVILDEIVNAFDQGFCRKKEFLDLIKNVPEDVELVLTGRGDVSGLEKFADYVTVMSEKKHPFRKQAGARMGIEY